MAQEKKNWWHPEEFQRRRDILNKRSRIMRATREFFSTFAEVETPALQTSPGLEPHLHAFTTSQEDIAGRELNKFYLHTSPEFAMKKLLVAGAGNIFQLARVFRNRERSHTHHPEFVMLEWYRTGANYEAVMEDTVGLLRAVARAAEAKEFRWQGKVADPFREWERISVNECFQKYVGIELLDTIENPLQPNPGRLAAVAKAKLGISSSPGDSWDDLFFRIFLDHIEPKLGVGSPTILYDYPISMAALSRSKKSDPRLAERFEVYVCGLELANAFSELTDAKIQRARFEADMDLKEELYGYRYPIDQDFLAALEHGLPECAGIALGMDRLVMLATGAEHIDEVLWIGV